MSETHGSAERTWQYRFMLPGGEVVETGEFGGNDLAERRARELSTARQAPIVVEYHNLVDWVYVTEADERG
jgi:hypothetical protein